MGWFKDNKRQGNWMSFNGIDMSIKESGWYQDDERMEEMKIDAEFKCFGRKEIFLEHYTDLLF